jgi:hypothetical protein
MSSDETTVESTSEVLVDNDTDPTDAEVNAPDGSPLDDDVDPDLDPEGDDPPVGDEGPDG